MLPCTWQLSHLVYVIYDATAKAELCGYMQNADSAVDKLSQYACACELQRFVATVTL